MAGSKRAIWKGIISFGLVNIPVTLHTAVSESGIDFDWLDKRSMDPVGYKRINKTTGEDIGAENIVRGIAYERGRYVVLSDEEIQLHLAKSTQSIDIESFIPAADISPAYIDRPYYLVPEPRSGKAYALLRETLARTGRAGIARVVIHTKQHLAALLPEKNGIILLLLRWADQIRPLDELDIPAAGDLNDKEITIATQLVEAMAEPWQPEKYQDSFQAEIMALVNEKAQSGHLETVSHPDTGASQGMGELVDLTDMLRRSLQARKATREEKNGSRPRRAPQKKGTGA